MAIEFDVKIRSPFTTRALLARALTHLRSFAVLGNLSSDQFDGARWGESEKNGVGRLDGTVASLLCHKAGEEAEMGEEGGYWLTVDAARSRTGAGFFLAAIVAIAAAEATGSSVLDEANLLRLGRSIVAADALAQLQTMAGQGDLDMISARLADALGLRVSGGS